MTWWIIFLEYCKKKQTNTKTKKQKKQKKNEKKQNKTKKTKQKKQNKTKQNKKNEKTKQKKNQKKFYICKSSPRVPWREFLFLKCLTRKTSFLR